MTSIRSQFTDMVVAGVVGTALVFGPAYAGIAVARADAPVMEDDPAWDCTTMGNLVCGPGNSNGVPAGRYEHGVLIDVWPLAY